MIVNAKVQDGVFDKIIDAASHLTGFIELRKIELDEKADEELAIFLASNFIEVI